MTAHGEGQKQFQDWASKRSIFDFRHRAILYRRTGPVALGALTSNHMAGYAEWRRESPAILTAFTCGSYYGRQYPSPRKP